MRNDYVYDWASAKLWIYGGKSKISRPLYDRYLGVRILEPDNPDSDISINYRYKHTIHDPIAKNRIDKSNIEWRTKSSETLDTPTPGDWHTYHRNPILVYKKDNNVAELYPVHRHSPGERRIMNDYAGQLIQVVGKRKVVKVRQVDDKVLMPKRRTNCKGCGGDKVIIYTCWDTGMDDNTLELLSKTKAQRTCSKISPHNTHVAKANCGICGGTGAGKINFNRLDSYVWEKDVTLLVDMRAGKILQEGRDLSVRSS